MTTPIPDEWPIEQAPDEDVDLDAAAEDARAVRLEPDPDDEIPVIDTGDARGSRSD